VLLSGGVGITPVLAMLKTLVHAGHSAPIYFVHAARNSRHEALVDEARNAARDFPNVKVHVRYDAPLADDFAEARCDSVGTVDVSLLQDLLASKAAEVYLCGPRGFMTALYHGLKAWGVDDRQIHFEFFGPKQELIKAPPSAERPPKPRQAVLS
jgi:nitric oxide dioxygenase